MPSRPFPDRWLLQDERLPAYGRNSGKELHASGAKSKFVDEDGSIYYALPRTMLEWNHANQRWLPLNPRLIRVPENMARLQATPYKATSSQEVESALDALGVSQPRCEHLPATARALTKYAVVLLGPAATKLWHAQGSKHVQALCLFCKEAALHGTCEHIHAALLHEGLVHTDVPSFPKNKRAPPPEAAHVAIAPGERLLLKQPSTGTAAEGEPESPRTLAQKVNQAQQIVMHFLKESSLAFYRDAFLEAGILLEDLAEWFIKDLDNVFGIPQPLGQKLLVQARRALRDHKQDSTGMQQ